MGNVKGSKNKSKRAANDSFELSKYAERLLENINDLVQSIGTDGKFVYVNRKWRKTLGYSLQAAQGMSFENILRRDQIEHCNKIFQGLLRGEKYGNIETVFVTKKGEDIYVEGNVNAVIEDGKVKVTIGVFHDITERKITGEAQQRLAAIVESSHDAIIGKTLDGIITSWNKGAEMHYGYSAAEVVGHPISILVPPERADEVPRFLEKIGRGEAIRDYETVRVTKEGQRITTLVTISPIKDASGKVVGASTIAQDITERKRAEEALQETEERYKSLFDHSLEAIYIADMNGNFTDANPYALKLLGYEKEEINSVNFLSLVDKESAELVYKISEEILRTGSQKESAEYKVRKKDGTYAWIETHASLLYKDKKPIGLQGIARDITERKRLEELLKVSEKRFRELADFLPQAICEIDLEGHLTYANRYGFESTGYTRENLKKGVNAIELFVPEQRDRIAKNIRAVLSGEKFDDHEYSVLRKDGSTYPALIYSNTIMRDGKPVGIRGIILDITERKKIEQMKTDFVAFISHQLRTPVAGLMAYIDNMLDGVTGALNDMQVDYLREMRGVCERNSRLIYDLLSISRIERGILAVNINPVDLRSVVDIAVKEYSKSIEEKGLALNIKEADQGIVVLADTDKLVEVLKNVIHNATKFTSKGSISIEIVAEGLHGIVKVSDTGIGMSKVALQDLFKKEKIFGGAVAAGGGAGLGLYIAKGFMQLQGGDITVDSVIGKGSTFVISLPRK